MRCRRPPAARFARGDRPLPGATSPRSVAVEAGISVSALNRRLKAEGTSFQRLLDDTRRCIAQRYLFESSLKLTDIAARVGYSELSAFSRAARR